MRVKRSGAYQIVNEVNGKSYVGSSQDITNRWGHWRASVKKKMRYKSLLQLAFRKYGIENFTFILLEECEPTKAALEAVEQKYIDLLKPEYNLLPVAYSAAGYKWTEEQKQKARDNYTEDRKLASSERFKAYMNDPAVKQKYSELRKGKTFKEIFGEELATIISERQSNSRTGKRLGIAPWNKGVPMTEAQRRTLSTVRKEYYRHHASPNLGRKMSDETKQKLKESLKIAMTPEVRQRIAQALKGRVGWNRGIPMTEEMKLALFAGRDRYHEDHPEHQVKMTEAARIVNTGKARPDEVRQKIRESHLVSEARKAFHERRRGIARSEDVKQKVSEGIKASDAFQASVKARVGRTRKDNKSGHYGIVWDTSKGKWMVRVNKKFCGRFVDLNDAVACRDAAVNQLRAAA